MSVRRRREQRGPGEETQGVPRAGRFCRSRRDHDPSVARAWRVSLAPPSDGKDDYHAWAWVRNGQTAMTRAARERKEKEEKENGDTQ